MKMTTQLVLTTAMLALATPVIVSDLTGSNAAHAKSENANGGNSGDKGNSGNNGNSGGNGNSGNNGNSGSNGNSDNARGNSGEKPLAASLKSLNSLNRNINGIMNSSDPKMVPVKAYLGAVQTAEEAAGALDTARADYADSYADLAAAAESLGLSETPETWASEIADMRSTLEANPVAEGEEGYDAYQEQLADLAEAEAALEEALADKAVLDQAEVTAAEAEEAISDDALRSALVAAHNATGNPPITEADVTPEMLDFARRELQL